MITRYSGLLALFFATFAFAVDPKETKLQQEEALHQGIWQVTSFMRNGKETAKEIVDSIERMVDGSMWFGKGMAKDLQAPPLNSIQR